MTAWIRRGPVAAWGLGTLLVLPGPGLAAQDEGRPATRVESRTEPLAFGAKLWVKNRNGGITVSGWDKEEVALTAEIRDSDQRRIELAWQRVGPDLDIAALPQQAHWSLGLGAVPTPWCWLTLNVPHRLLGQFRTTNGPIRVEAVVGFVRCETVNGDITLEDIAGEVVGETSNGNLEARGLHARIRGGTANGRIVLENVDGQVRVETTNGFIKARNLDGWGEGISLESTNGAIDLELGRATGELQAETANGTIRIHVPGCQVLENGKYRVRVRVPGRNQKITLASTNGSIQVH
jgi:ribosomal protein S28E/S33